MKRLFLILVFFLSGCSQQEFLNCMTDVAYDLGTLSAQEVTNYEQSGCCVYNGGVSPYVSCSGLIVCQDMSVSTCRR